MYAPAAAGLPPLPADFWTMFPNDPASASVWVPIGTAKTIPSLSPTAPAILEWDWTTPATAPDHSCLLVVMDCAADPIPAGSKVFDVDTLVTQEKRAGLKNLHVVDAAPGTSTWRAIDLYARTDSKTQAIRLLTSVKSSGVGILLPKSAKTAKATGVVAKPSTKTMVAQVKKELGAVADALDTTKVYTLDASGGRIEGLRLSTKPVTVAVLLPAAAKGTNATLTIVQEDQAGTVAGGSTFVVRASG